MQKTEETENLEPELGAEEDTAEENTEGENETGTKQGKTEETDQSDKNKSGKCIEAYCCSLCIHIRPHLFGCTSVKTIRMNLRHINPCSFIDIIYHSVMWRLM